MSVVRTWGSTEQERAETFPCDAFLPDPDDSLFRAVDVTAPAAPTFRWLCQLRIAPYSYDWIDNFGRRSPRRLIEGLDELAIGQRFMSIFELVDFERDRHITIRLDRLRSLFGAVAMTYRVVPVDDERSRLVVKLLVRYPRGIAGVIGRAVLPAGDLLMMRKQLRTLAALASSGRP